MFIEINMIFRLENPSQAQKSKCFANEDVCKLGELTMLLSARYLSSVEQI